MTRIESIRETVETILKEAGLESHKVFLNDDSWCTSLFDTTTLQGLLLSIEDVYRHNATDSDVSVKIIIDNYVGNTGHYVYRGKPMNSSWSEKRIKNEVAKAIEAYRI